MSAVFQYRKDLKDQRALQKGTSLPRQRHLNSDRKSSILPSRDVSSLPLLSLTFSFTLRINHIDSYFPAGLSPLTATISPLFIIYKNKFKEKKRNKNTFSNVLNRMEFVLNE